MIPIYVKNTLLNFLSFFLIALSLYIFIALVSYNPSDSGFFNVNSNTLVQNLCGPLGAKIADFLITILGVGSYLVLLIGSVWALQILFFKDPYNSKIKISVRFISSVILLVSFCSVMEYYFGNDSGGNLGKSTFVTLSNGLGFIGSLIFLIIFIIPASSLAFNFSWLNIIDSLGLRIINIFYLTKSYSELFFTKLINAGSYIRTKLKEQKNSINEKRLEKKVAIKQKKHQSTKSEKVSDFSTKVISSETKQPDLPNTTETKLKEIDSTPNKESDSKAVMPSTELLDRALDDGSSLSEEELKQIADLLETKLQEFGIEASVESVLPGPVVTRFEIQPAPGTKASKITGIAQDIARSLSVSSVRVVEVIEGKSYVGIEIPNTNRKMVRLTEILSSQAFKSSPSNLTLALGHDISGNPVVVDLAKMPHLLVAGTTGSGKSVGVNAMLLSLLFKSDPKDVRLILIDPKMLELSVYDGIPHLLTPVITDMTDASNGLRWCVVEMDRRYKLMSMMGVRNLAGFNKKIEDAAANGKADNKSTASRG
jgi:S-DNA-T family DNA segregation ATPase FtsK/SpoIIIE